MAKKLTVCLSDKSKDSIYYAFSGSVNV